MSPATGPGMSLPARLWAYQAERFPLGRTALLVAVFTSASLNASAHMAGRPLPGLAAYIVAFFVTLILFFHLRAADEIKDHDDDCRYRPERPIPRGLVSLRLVVGLAAGLVPVALLLAGGYWPALLLPLGLVWLWLALMTAEFFVPRWLKARPAAYLVSHMAIMPLIDLFVTAVEWLPGGGRPAPTLALFLALSFANGCVLEIGRKLYAPESERPGVETYSAVYGPATAALLWMASAGAATVLLALVGQAVGLGWRIVAAAGLMLAVALAAGLSYRNHPTRAAEKRMDTLSGLWVFVCYVLAGHAPLLAGA